MTLLDYLPPFHDGKDLLIDGGYINNCPVDIMRELHSSISLLIAVDVENKNFFADQFSDITFYGDHLSGVCCCFAYLIHACV